MEQPTEVRAQDSPDPDHFGRVRRRRQDAPGRQPDQGCGLPTPTLVALPPANLAELLVNRPPLGRHRPPSQGRRRASASQPVWSSCGGPYGSCNDRGTQSCPACRLRSPLAGDKKKVMGGWPSRSGRAQRRAVAADQERRRCTPRKGDAVNVTDLPRSLPCM